METNYIDNHTCIMDYAGNYNQCGFWYDYYPFYKAVKFGGLLSDIPNMPVDHEPTEEECETWIKDHKEFDFRPLDKLTVEIIVEVYSKNEITKQLQIKLKEKENEMREQKKSRVRVLRKKLAEIDSGKWKATDADKRKLQQALVDAEFVEKEGNLKK